MTQALASASLAPTVGYPCEAADGRAVLALFGNGKPHGRFGVRTPIPPDQSSHNGATVGRSGSALEKNNS